MWKKFQNMFFGRELDFRERLFRVVLFIACGAASLTIIESFVIMEIGLIVVLMLLLIIVMGGAMFVTLKYHKYDWASVVVGIALITVLFPSTFILSGGIQGGAMIWFVLGIVYVFLMFSGKKLAVFVGICVITDCLTFRLAYKHPEIFRPLKSEEAVYIDALFSVLAAGIVVGGILKFQIRMYQIEREVALKQKEELERISKSKNAFFANMSHEIRTPINTIVGLNEMILREEVSDDIRDYAQNIKSASKALLNLINDILDLSQIEVKKMEIVPRKYSTKELFGDLIDMIRVPAKAKELELIFNIDHNLPSALLGDEKRIHQVLLNVLTNAVKYTNTGSVVLSAYIDNIKDNKLGLKIEVADTGVGIRKEDLAYLYDAFRRADEKNNLRIEGSGLGLSITKQLIDLMGGEISVDSIYTKGTTFTIYLEQEIVDSTPIGSYNFMQGNHFAERYQYIQMFEAPEARVLIVDDNEVNAMVAKKLLKATKMQVDCAKSGQECLEKTKQKYYHVILMDYMMPKMNGAETIKEIRKQQNGLCRDSAVILLTGNSIAYSQKICEEYGFDGFMEKPINGQKLEKGIMKYLPQEIIEFHNVSAEEKDISMRSFSGRKRKKIYITSDCVCDLPEEILEEYDIRLMYFYIRTDKGRFADIKEISSDNLTEYLSAEGVKAYADSASVEEYKEFFAETLTQAEQVIHISMAKNIGQSYKSAVAAAEGFDHVRVVDSGQISGGEGLLVLYAAQLVLEGYHAQEIVEKINEQKSLISNQIILKNANYLQPNSYISKVLTQICNSFRLHPMLTLKRSRLFWVGVQGGKLENAWKYFVYRSMMKKKKICDDIILVTYVGCNVEQLELVQKEILKNIAFQKVIIQKASCSTACNSGIGSVSISYFYGNKADEKQERVTK